MRCRVCNLCSIPTLGCLLFLLCLSAQSEPPTPRTWTSADGRYTTVATLVAVENDSARLRKADGSLIEVPLGKLCEADCGFLRSVLPTKAEQNVIAGKVIGVTDGDTLTILDESKASHKIRLEGIDCPESGQEHGAQARKALAEKVFGKQVTIRTSGKDKYARTLGHIYLDDRWINKEMVEDGWAWHYKKYSSDEELSRAEVTARSGRNGLWAHDSPIPPWEFRNLPRQEPRVVVSEPVPAVSPTPNVQPSSRYWLNTSSGVRHNEGCRWFGNTKSGHYCGPDEGRPCGICKG